MDGKAAKRLEVKRKLEGEEKKVKCQPKDRAQRNGQQSVFNSCLVAKRLCTKDPS